MHDQEQKKEKKKHTINKFVGFHNHSPILTVHIDTLNNQSGKRLHLDQCFGMCIIKMIINFIVVH